jgi:hypothetical protein
MSRSKDLDYFYALLSQLEKKNGGYRKLESANGRMTWPQRGLYFFFEPGELRTSSGMRVVRVGTHGLKPNAKSSLWQRLSQHQGTTKTGGGNHRGSIFRLIVGASIKNRDHLRIPSWGKESSLGVAARKLSSSRENLRQLEMPLEIAVSNHIKSMPFVWLEVPDEPGPDSLRAFIEKNSIALLSNFDKDPIDPPSSNWLGNNCDRTKVKTSGLWNSDHVDARYSPEFLKILGAFILQD